jgi:hypothetical protein
VEQSYQHLPLLKMHTTCDCELVTWRWGDVETELKQNKSSKQRKIFRPLSDVDWRERERKKVATARIGGVKVNT